MAEMNDDELLDALGVEVAPLKVSCRTPREERIIAGLKTFCASIRPTAAPLSTTRTVIFSSVCMQYAWINCASCQKRKRF